MSVEIGMETAGNSELGFESGNSAAPAEGSITTAMLQDGAVTEEKLAEEVMQLINGKLDVTTLSSDMVGDCVSQNTLYKIIGGQTGETYFIYVPSSIPPIQYKITNEGIFRRTSALNDADLLGWSDWQEYVSKEYVDSVAEKIAADADSKIKQNIPHDTVTGSSVTLTDHITNMEVRDYRIYGNSIQDGEPTPDAPIDIQSVGDLVTDESDEHYGKYDVPVTVRGKNLFNKDYFIETCNASVASGYEVTEETFGGKECMKVYGIALGIIKKYPTAFKENTQYTISFDHYDVPYNSNVGMIITAKYSDDTSEKVFTSETTGGVWKTHNWTSAAGKTISYLSYSYGTGAAYTYISNWQIEEGTAATAYEPYTSETYHIYLDEPLRKVGDYADYIDYQNQQVVRNIRHMEITSSLSWNDRYSGVIYTNLTAEYTVNTEYDLPLPTNRSSTDYGYFQTSNTSGTAIGFYLSEGYWSFTTKEEMLAWLDTHDMYVEYPLATPITEAVTMPQLTVPEIDTAVIECGTTVESNIEVTYYQDINKIIAELKAAYVAQGGIQ